MPVKVEQINEYLFSDTVQTKSKNKKWKGLAQPTDISSLLQFLAPAFFPSLRKVLQLALTVAIANVSAGRSFSCMRRIARTCGVLGQKSD